MRRPPLLVVRSAGASAPRSVVPTLFLVGACVLILISPGVFLASSSTLLGVGWKAVAKFLARWLLVFAVAAGAVLFVLVAAISRWRLARGGTVEFHAYAILFQKGAGPPASVRWQDVTGFSDDSADFIKIHARTTTYPPDMLTVPTATELARTAVLALLVERGILRVENGT